MIKERVDRQWREQEAEHRIQKKNKQEEDWVFSSVLEVTQKTLWLEAEKTN